MVTMSKTKEFEKMGVYRETSLDKAKKESNRLISISGSTYTVDMINGERVNFKRAKFDEWTKTNTYISDF